LSKIEEGFEKAEDKENFRRKHWKELGEIQSIKALQSKLNRRRREINNLKSKEETPVRKKQIQKIENERTELIRTFLKQDIRYLGGKESIWGGILGNVKEMDNTQSEIARLVDAGQLKYSSPPTRYITYKHEQTELPDDLYLQYVADVEKTEKQLIDNLIVTDTWLNASDAKRSKMVKRLIEKARKAAKKRIRKELLKRGE
jgi:hypothetical protein